MAVIKYTANMKIIDNILPFLSWKGIITKSTLKSDLIAGLIWAIVVLPQWVAFATIAGLPPEYWLYSAIVPPIIAALWGSSWHLISGPTTAISLVVYASISHIVAVWTPEYVSITLTLTLMVWVMQVLLWIMKFGTLLEFISHTVTISFTAWAAILIASSQIKNFFGVPIPQGASFFQTISVFLNNLHDINPYILAISLSTFVIGFVIKKYLPKVPYMIPAMIVWSLIGYYINTYISPGLIKTVWALPSWLPPLSLPSFHVSTLMDLSLSALVISILALVEAVAIAKAIGIKSWQRINWNQEFMWQWLSNIVWGFFSAYPSSWSFNRTWLNYESWARTPLSSIFASISLAIIIIFFWGITSYLPVAVMAWVLFLVAYGLIDLNYVSSISKASRWETLLYAITFLSTLSWKLEFAILIWVLMSIALYLNKTNRPIITESLPDPTSPKRKFIHWENLLGCPQFEIIRIDGTIYFGNINYIEDIFRSIHEKNPDKKFLLIRGSRITFIDLSWVELLVHEAKIRRKEWWDLYISNLNDDVLKTLKKYDYKNELKLLDNAFESKAVALSKIYPNLDKSICRKCQKKVFEECCG